MTDFAIAIDGMHCAACARRVKAALERVDGVAVDAVTIGAARGTLADVAVTDVVAAVARAGYAARSVG